MGDSSDIDALIKDMNSDSLSNEENSMVNSILNHIIIFFIINVLK